LIYWKIIILYYDKLFVEFSRSFMSDFFMKNYIFGELIKTDMTAFVSLNALTKI
jgi:hypothetical protein